MAFRRTTDPYAVLVSEAMAQQTQAARAADHWERFMVQFPTVHDLAAATPADILRAWAGLGYDRRALALWRTARIIVAEHDGRVPGTIEALLALPGVGPYTARAIASLAFGVRVGAVDVNVRRVLGRIVAGAVGEVRTAELQRIADAAVPADRPGVWTHAVMDVGATLCKPRAPRCGDCPARPWCRFAARATRAGATAAPSGSGGRAGHARKRPVPFASTNRWLRGRILNRLRRAPDGEWVVLDAPIGSHDLARVRAATTTMASDGLVELDPTVRPALRARLPLT